MSDDINDAVTSAVAEAKTESGVSEPTQEAAQETKTDESPEPKAEEKTEKGAPKETASEDEEEEFFNPTAEELAIIEKSPELKKAYKAFQKGFTKKTTDLKKLREQAKQEIEVAQYIRANPEAAARELAQIAGLTIAEARAEIKEAAKAADSTSGVVDELQSKWAKVVGEEAAALLRPLFEETAKATIEREVYNLRQQTEFLTKQAQQKGITAAVREFGASVVERGEDWSDDVQNEMAKIAGVIAPGDDTSISDYLSTLYDAVQARRSRARLTKQNVDRLRRIREEQEPTTATRSQGKPESKITTDMSDKDAVALAVAQAREQLK